MNVGLDLKAWLEEDLLDILIAGHGFAPFTLQVEDFTGVAHRHGVPVYPCINSGPTDTLSDGAFLECVRALATNWYQAGADGIYLWNLGSPLEYKSGRDLIETRQKFYSCLNEIGDHQALAGKDKLYFIDNNLSSGVFNYYTHITSHPPLPVTSKQGTIRVGVIQHVPLVVGDDLKAATESGLLRQAKLTIKFSNPAWKDILLFQLNGEPLTDGEFVASAEGKSGCEMSYLVNAPPLKTGRNFIEISAKHSKDIPESSVQISSIKLKVEYKTK
jgi:hypothetical protein